MSAANTPQRWLAAMREHPAVTLVSAVLAILGGLASWATITGQPLFPTEHTTAALTPTAAPPTATGTTPVQPRKLEPHWSPARATYTASSLPTKPVLNSVTDNATVGDELSFAGVRLTDPTDTADWDSSYNAAFGDTLQVRLTVNNDACPYLGANGTIHGLRVLVEFDRTATQTAVTAWLEGDNADIVSDTVVIDHPKDVYIDYTRDSASFQNATGWHDVPNTIGNQEWTALGSGTLNGDYGVGADGAGWVLFTLWATRNVG